MNAPTITPFLWFDGQAEEAARYYVSVFAGSEIGAITRYGDSGPGPKGSVMTVSFKLAGVEFTALNGGPDYRFTEAVSFVVTCRTQKEIDHFWDKLSAGGSPGQCGWLKDRFGLSWQVVPAGLVDLIKSPRAMQAMLAMKKLDLKRLQEAAAG